MTHRAVAVRGLPPLDAAAEASAATRLERLTKPPGSLGRLEGLAIQLAGIRGQVVTDIVRPAIVVFAADHGVTRQGVSPYPSAVTRQMVLNFVAGGAAVNVLARAAGAELVVVDVGVAGDRIDRGRPPARGLAFVADRVRSGTRDLTEGPAMTIDETAAAIAVGRRVVAGTIAGDVDLVALGEMGIGNTTAASALVAALTGRPPAVVTGRGTGVDDAGLRRKIEVVERALSRHLPRSDAEGATPPDALAILAALGGLEIAALVGAMLEAAERRIPVVLDGFITGAAALVAGRLAPGLPARLIAGHRSTEPGHAIALDELRLEPLLELDLRLGEGSGAALAIPIVRTAARICGEMATFDEAGVSNTG